MSVESIYFSLGSNLGDRKVNIEEALRRLDLAFGTHYKLLSKLIETKPVGFSGGDFLNAAVLYEITVQEEWGEEFALDTLAKVKSIERDMGRTDPPEYSPDGERIYHSRIIDIDILFLGKKKINLPQLTIPHKNISDRPFVMVPLLEIAQPGLKEAFPEYF